MWMAGGGTKGGTIYGETDDFSYNIVRDPVHIRDFHATVLQLLGFDHERFTYRFQGLDQRSDRRRACPCHPRTAGVSSRPLSLHQLAQGINLPTSPTRERGKYAVSSLARRVSMNS